MERIRASTWGSNSFNGQANVSSLLKANVLGDTITKLISRTHTHSVGSVTNRNLTERTYILTSVDAQRVQVALARTELLASVNTSAR